MPKGVTKCRPDGDIRVIIEWPGAGQYEMTAIGNEFKRQVGLSGLGRMRTVLAQVFIAGCNLVRRSAPNFPPPNQGNEMGANIRIRRVAHQVASLASVPLCQFRSVCL